MPTIAFHGNVYPKGSLIDATMPDLDWKWEEMNLDLHFRVSIKKSVISIECDLARFEKDYLGHLYIRSLDLAKTAVNIACFATGLGATAVLEWFRQPSGVQTPLHFQDPALAEVVKSFQLEANGSDRFSKIVRTVVADPALFITFHDLIETQTIPHVGLTNCGRVVDSLRRQIAPNLEGNQAWDRMRTALKISRPYLQFITDRSTGPRHGDRSRVEGPIVMDVCKRTWSIMDRYLSYRLLGTDLTEPDDPELV